MKLDDPYAVRLAKLLKKRYSLNKSTLSCVNFIFCFKGVRLRGYNWMHLAHRP